MRRLITLRLALGLLAGLAWIWSAQGELAGQAKPDNKADSKKAPDKSEKVKFETVDGVELQGSFYPSTKGKKAVTVLLLHNVGGNSQQEGWDKLARELNEKDFAVLTFDFRGHGNSTAISPNFWGPLYNNRQLVKGYSPNRPKEKISYKDFQSTYYPRLVDDIAAAKTYLDKRNDAGDCNSANLVVIGAEEGAALGALWIHSEFNRYRITGPPFPVAARKRDPNSEGKKILAAVWISMTHLRGQPSGVREWLKTAGHDNKVPMYFVYGEKDSAGDAFANSMSNALKTGSIKLELTGAKKIPDTNLKGHELLGGKSLETSSIISKYLTTIAKEKPGNDWDQREFEKTAYIWQIGLQQLNAKQEGEKSLLPVPLARFLR